MIKKCLPFILILISTVFSNTSKNSTINIKDSTIMNTHNLPPSIDTLYKNKTDSIINKDSTITRTADKSKTKPKITNKYGPDISISFWVPNIDAFLKLRSAIESDSLTRNMNLSTNKFDEYDIALIPEIAYSYRYLNSFELSIATGIIYTSNKSIWEPKSDTLESIYSKEQNIFYSYTAIPLTINFNIFINPSYFSIVNFTNLRLLIGYSVIPTWFELIKSESDLNIKSTALSNSFNIGLALEKPINNIYSWNLKFIYSKVNSKVFKSNNKELLLSDIYKYESSNDPFNISYSDFKIKASIVRWFSITDAKEKKN